MADPSPPASTSPATASLTAAEVVRLTHQALALAAPLGMASLAASLLALGLSIALPPVSPQHALPLISLLPGLVAAYHALRARYDHAVFADWARAWQHPGADPARDMAAFDAGLAHAGFPRPATSPAIEARAAGALGLLRRLALACLTQYACLGLAAAQDFLFRTPP